ncbi:MAG: hypothetical protein B6I34_03040 [Anaerolineaceae bacterium 4572_32.1]|nr:MAG: hypothetical protein B6I34_03040 [Anaerolineaceae bacterium 4572_32.1]
MLMWFILLIILILLALLLYWTLVIAEGSYLGARFVAWLYDLTAKKYDGIKKFSKDDEETFLGVPLWRTIQPVRRPLVLDVATGTARLPLVLLSRLLFDGRIIALDLSLKMLRQACEKLASYDERVTFIHQDAMQLPFPDETFDALTCLEALEFLPSPKRALEEMLRVLRPGGVLLTTNRIGWEAKLLPGKALAPTQLRAILNELPLQAIEVRRWQVFYDQVWARKEGLTPAKGNGDLDLSEILRCPNCLDTHLEKSAVLLRCPRCARAYPIENGIILLSKGR